VTAPAPVVQVEELIKRFPTRLPLRERIRRPFHREWFEALDGVSIEVRTGELFGLLGPNGAGKTTLLKVLSTLVLPDEGTVTIDGHDVRHSPAAVREVLTPVIADERSLDWRLTAAQNLELYAALYRLPSAQRDARIATLLRRVGLVDAGDRLVGAFSSGMKQRLLIARALLSDPRVLILDEPTRSLDPVSARDLRDLIRTALVERDGCAVLLATHNAEEAFGLCDRLAVLHRGRVIARGTADELAHRAGRSRFRLVVPVARESDARAVLERLRRDETGRPTDGAWIRRAPDPEEGWVALEVDLPGGADRSAAVLSALARTGIDVAELGRVPLPLAELIERLVDRADE